jgi:glycosyltransferase involved in cell wall biosynthesis
MASKTPVIASSVGAIPRLITDHRTGLLIALGDVAGLQHAVAELLTSPGLRTQIADNAFSFVREHYSAEAMAFKYVQMYAEALPQSAPTSPSIASASANSI